MARNRYKSTSVDAIFERTGTMTFDGSSESVIDVGHRTAFEMSRGTISLGFTLDTTAGRYALVGKDNSDRGDGGEFTLWAWEGKILVSFESATGTEWLEVPDLEIEAGVEMHVALSFGNSGLQIYVNGVLAAAEPGFEQGIELNDQNLTIGGTRAWHGSDSDPAHSVVRGSISNFQVFDRQLGEADMVALASDVDSAIGQQAMMAEGMEDLAPVFHQLHGASDTLLDILEDYGVSMHGHMSRMLDMKGGNNGDNEINGTRGHDGINGRMGDDTIKGGGGNDVLQGDYGNDRLAGGAGRDILDGGHGEDVLNGGGGNDLLISRADGREPATFQDPDAPDQRIPADDVLIGGGGADIFYFQTLINARRRFLEEHTREDGTINWHGVAGENDNYHDHWVDHLGNDVVMDFSRGEGDRIVIEGHTTEIGDISYGDANGDGVMDHSVITIYSDQGSGGGAHHMDALGTITVYGDLVRWSDIEHSSGPAYGIVENIDDLGEALRARDDGENRGRIRPPSDLEEQSGPDLPSNTAPVVAMPDWVSYDAWPGDYLDVGHSRAMELENGTISLGFRMDGIAGEYALISKDNRDRADGGEFTVWVRDGRIVVVHESADGHEWLQVPDVMIEAGETYQFAMSFGRQGMMVWLNGQLVAAEPEFTQGIDMNDRSLVVGGTRAWRGDDEDSAHSLFRGEIGDIYIFDEQLSERDMIALAGDVQGSLGMQAQMADAMSDLAPILDQAHHGSETLQDILAEFGVNEHGHMSGGLRMRSGNNNDNEINGRGRDDGLNGQLGDDVINGRDGDDVLQGDYGNDRLMGGAGRDILDGGHGEDRLNGGNGADLLISRADGREGDITYIAGRDEIDRFNGNHQNQLIPGDDILTGGRGADIFYFQTLINAQLRYIREHTNDDGRVNWHGVAGENDGLHDHWVDTMGNDVITDYSRAEGDRIVIEGHTTEIQSIIYGDADGDGVMDHSIIQLYSDQGNNGGAHHLDLLGTITVYGDLVRMSDIEHTAAPAYGIVTTIDDLGEARSPRDEGTDTGRIRAPRGMDEEDGLQAANGRDPVVGASGTYRFLPEERAALILEHSDAMDMRNGTIAFSFSLNTIIHNAVIFSKDATDYGNGGHVSAYMNADGDLVLRFQDGSGDSHYLVAAGALEAGQSYDFAFSFGRDGASLWLDGVRVAYEADVTFGLERNTEHMIFGAGGWGNEPGETNRTGSYMDGTITDIRMYRGQLDGDDVWGDSPRDNIAYFNGSVRGYAIDVNDAGRVVVSRGGEDTVVSGQKDFVVFGDFAARVDDVQVGNRQDNQLFGGDGADVLIGGRGNDDLRGDSNDDLMRGGAGDDSLSGGNGNDIMYGDTGDDNLYGGDHSDAIWGGSGNDELKGGAGNDRLWGGTGDDFIYGDSWGEAGNARNDRVYYNGNFADYTFETSTIWNGSRGEDMDRLIVTDRANGGADGVYEGRDYLMDIDVIVFADRTVNVADLL